jgi:tetratricopeptide (TPR) repeat protein
MAMLAAVPFSLRAQGTMPEWGRPLTPAEGRALNEEVHRLSGQLHLRETTLVAIARILGMRQRTIGFPELVRQVQSQAARAAELQSQLQALHAQFAALTDAAVRAPAEGALARATAAFDEGRLDDADREFAALEALRSSESEAARTAWHDAIDARARIAELQLNFDRAEELHLEASREEQRASAQRQWHDVMEAAEARHRQDDLVGDNAALNRAIILYREMALPLAPRSERPLDWAMTQNDLGTALSALGERERGTTNLDQAVAAFGAALEERTRARVPQEWARTQVNLGTTLRALGQRQLAAEPLERAVRAYEAALTEITRERDPLGWAMTQNNLGNALWAIGALGREPARLEQAIQVFNLALSERTRNRVPLEWAETQNNLGNALRTLGEIEPGVSRLEAAAAAFHSAQLELTYERAPLRWAMTQNNLGLTFEILGEREGGTARLEQAVAAYRGALGIFASIGAVNYRERTEENLQRVQTLLAQRLGQ